MTGGGNGGAVVVAVWQDGENGGEGVAAAVGGVGNDERSKSRRVAIVQRLRIAGDDDELHDGGPRID